MVFCPESRQCLANDHIISCAEEYSSHTGTYVLLVVWAAWTVVDTCRVVCLTLLAFFFFPFASLVNMYMEFPSHAEI